MKGKTMHRRRTKGGGWKMLRIIMKERRVKKEKREKCFQRFGLGHEKSTGFEHFYVVFSS